MPKTCPTCKNVFAHLPAHLNKKNKCTPPAGLTLESLAERISMLETQIQDLIKNTQQTLEPTNTLHMEKNAISLFSGAGGDTCGLERAGYSVVAFSEFNDPATQTHKAVFPNSVLLTDPKGAVDIKKIPDAVFTTYKGNVSLIFAGFPCFVAGTRVLTDAGYMPIEHVGLDRTLMTHTGKFQPIVNLQKKIYNQTLYKIRIQYHPEILTTTDEHPFYVRERITKWDNSIRKYTYTFAEPVWKSAKTLTMDDYFGMVVNTKSVIPEFSVDVKVNQSRTDKTKKIIDSADEWFMMGYFIGDGWIEDTLRSEAAERVYPLRTEGSQRDTTKMDGRIAHKIRFAVNNADEDTILKRLQRVLPITDKECSTGKCKKYGCADITWYTILKHFGKYAHGKIIPEWVQDAPTHLIQEFINGYHAADGCVHRNNLRFTTVSYNLALGLQRLYLKLGNIVSIQKYIRAPTCVIQGRVVNQRDTYTIGVETNRQRNRTSFIENGYAWMRPVSIQTCETEPVPVYNFEVDTDNSYIVDNTIVHNCQGFSHAGRKNVDDSRNELVYEFARAAKLIEPEWIIGENVKGLLARKGHDPTQPRDAPLRPVIDIIRDLFERTGYKITYKLIDVTEIGVPQHRKRVIIVGHRGTLYPHMMWDDLEPASTPPQTAIRSFLEPHLQGAMEIPALYSPQAQPAHYWIPTTETAATGTPHPNMDRLVRGIRNKTSVEKRAEIAAGEVSDVKQVVEPAGLISYGVRKGGYHGMILNPDVACNTIISTYNLCPRLFVGLYNATTGKYWIRCMTPKELGQIQGFPADYAWRGPEKAQIAQIGNAVPPPLAERIARSLSRVEFKTTPQVTSAVEDDGEEEEEE
jgi:DNA-cytosine methyltransferase